MKMNLRFLALTLLFIAAAGCAGKRTKIDFTLVPERILGDVKQNVRTEKVYRDLDTILIADVFYYDQRIKQDFIQTALTKEWIDAGQAEKMMAESKLNEPKEVEFLAGVYTGDKRWNDFEKENSMWKVALQTPDGGWIAPASIEKLKLEKMRDAYLFPFLTEWKFIYRITFPKKELAGAANYKLRFTSLVGEAAFAWDLGGAN